MSSTTVPVAPPPSARRNALLPRLVSFFSGSVGLAVKIALLAILNALDLWALFVLLEHGHYVAAGVLVAATLLVDWIYLGARRAVPWKFLIPGTIFLVAFQVAPIVYTVEVAFTNYSTGHILQKADAIRQIELVTLQPPPNGKQYTMAAARDSGGTLVLILRDDANGKTYVGSKEGLTPIPAADVTAGALGITAAKGYRIVKGGDLFTLDAQLRDYVVPVGANNGIRPQGISQAVELAPTLRWNGAQGTFTRIADGSVFRDDGKGSFVNDKGEELEPGWKTGIGGANFSRIWSDPQVRHPFIRVFVWTFVFATTTVFLSFALGLFLAIALNKKGMRLQRLYRATIVVPWAVPGFLSLLVWQGLLNDEFGVVNRLFHLHVPWLFDANWAKVSIILVSTWLTVPYFFLVSLGALQSIPEELNEAARVDGGGPLQLFRRVTLPLLMVAVSPLLIASFAFNFNNFNNIYLLTSGGPPMNDSSIAGSTDILISYTYKLAIQTGKGQDFGLAAAFTVLIFLIVATISAISFSKTKALENIN